MVMSDIIVLVFL